MLLVHFPLELACLTSSLSNVSVRTLLNYKSCICFLELLPAASFDNAYHSIADHTLFVSVIFMQYFFLSSIFNL